jgi:hypothetical protein
MAEKPYLRGSGAGGVLSSATSIPGLTAIGADAYKPWQSDQTHNPSVRADSTKCLHHEFHIMDAEPGLVYPGVPIRIAFRSHS